MCHVFFSVFGICQRGGECVYGIVKWEFSNAIIKFASPHCIPDKDL